MHRKYYYKENPAPLEWDGDVSNPYNHWIEERMCKVQINKEDHFCVLKIYLVTPNRKFLLDKCDPCSNAYIAILEDEFPKSIPVVFVHRNMVSDIVGDGIDHDRIKYNADQH